jgi:hypothetical protein
VVFFCGSLETIIYEAMQNAFDSRNESFEDIFMRLKRCSLTAKVKVIEAAPSAIWWTMKEYFWQFRISDASYLSDHGVAFFARKSSEMAAM